MLNTITLSRFCDAPGGAVVGCEPESETTSEIFWVTSSQIRFREDRIRFSRDWKPKRILSRVNRIRSSLNRIWDDVTQKISDVISDSGSHQTTALPGASQNLERVILASTQIDSIQHHIHLIYRQRFDTEKL